MREFACVAEDRDLLHAFNQIAHLARLKPHRGECRSVSVNCWLASDVTWPVIVHALGM